MPIVQINNTLIRTEKEEDHNGNKKLNTAGITLHTTLHVIVNSRGVRVVCTTVSLGLHDCKLGSLL